MKILIVEDDPSVSDMLRAGLVSDSHVMDIASDGIEGSFLARTYDYDAIILDHALPGKNGITVCKDIRGIGKTTPIIFLSIDADTDTKPSQRLAVLLAEFGELMLDRPARQDAEPFAQLKDDAARPGRQLGRRPGIH